MRFTVVVPTYQRPEALRACLEGLAAVRYPRDDFEVVVVDDASATSPKDVIAAFADRMRVRLVPRSRNGGPATARNAGARAAEGEVLVFLDDDCIPAPDFLNAMGRALLRHPHAFLGGKTINGLPHNACATASQAIIDFLYEWNDGRNRGRWFVTTGVACSRDLFFAHGGFDESFPLAAGEDRDISDRLSEAGVGLVHVPEASVEHVRPLTLRGFWKQHFTYGRGAVFLHAGRERRGAPPTRIESIRFYFSLVTYPLRQRLGLRIAMLAAVSQVAYVAGYLAERRRQRHGLLQQQVSREQKPKGPGLAMRRGVPRAARKETAISHDRT